jgi:transposase
MAELRRSPAGGPMEHDLRAVLDAIGYVTRYGIEWRALPVDLPPWEAVYAFFLRWNQRGLPQGLVDRLRDSCAWPGAGRSYRPPARWTPSR